MHGWVDLVGWSHRCTDCNLWERLGISGTGYCEPKILPATQLAVSENWRIHNTVIWPYAQWYTDMSAVSGYGGWAAGRTSGLYKIERWDAGSWCHYHSLSLASVKSRLVFPLWYWLIRVVTHKGPLNGCVCIRYKEILNSFVYCWWSGNWLLIPLVKILSLYLVSNFWKFKCFDCV